MDRKDYMRRYHADYKKRMAFVKFVLPRALFARLEKFACHEGKRPGSLARELVEAALRGDSYQPVRIRSELRALRFLLRGIANNVNQMAHHSNVLKKVADERRLFAELGKLEEAVTAYTNGRLKQADDNQINE